MKRCLKHKINTITLLFPSIFKLICYLQSFLTFLCESERKERRVLSDAAECLRSTFPAAGNPKQDNLCSDNASQTPFKKLSL